MGDPADLRLRGAPRRGARRLRQQLRAEAHPQERHAFAEQPAQHLLLPAHPRIGALLIHVHGAPEHHRGAEPVELGRAAVRGSPLHQLVPGLAHDLTEHPGAGVRLVDDREDPHAIAER